MRYEKELKKFINDYLEKDEKLISFHINDETIEVTSSFGMKLPKNSSLIILITNKRFIYLIFTPKNNYKKDYSLNRLLSLKAVKKLGKVISVVFNISGESNPLLINLTLNDLIELKKILPKYNKNIKFNFKILANEKRNETVGINDFFKRLDIINILLFMFFIVIIYFIYELNSTKKIESRFDTPEKTFNLLLKSLSIGDNKLSKSCFDSSSELYHISNWFDSSRRVNIHIPSLVKKDKNVLITDYRVVDSIIDEDRATLKIEAILKPEFFGNGKETKTTFEVNFVNINGEWKIGM